MAGQSWREGRRGRRVAALVPRITITPESVKRVPAKSICEAVSVEPTENST